MKVILVPRRLGRAGLPEFRHRLSPLVALLVDLAAAPDFQIQALAQRIHHRDADAVQSAGNLVGIVVELAARMQDRHDHFGRRFLRLLMKIGRNAAPVVDHRDAVVDVDGDFDPACNTR